MHSVRTNAKAPPVRPSNGKDKQNWSPNAQSSIDTGQEGCSVRTKPADKARCIPALPVSQLSHPLFHHNVSLPSVSLPSCSPTDAPLKKKEEESTEGEMKDSSLGTIRVSIVFLNHLAAERGERIVELLHKLMDALLCTFICCLETFSRRGDGGGAGGGL